MLLLSTPLDDAAAVPIYFKWVDFKLVHLHHILYTVALILPFSIFPLQKMLINYANWGNIRQMSAGTVQKYCMSSNKKNEETTDKTSGC